MNDVLKPDAKMLLELNEFIHADKFRGKYHMQHITYVGAYARELNHRLAADLDDDKLIFIGMAHDTFKERSLRPGKNVSWNGHRIPQDTNRYVRQNLNMLEEYGLEDFFNTDIQLHPLSAGIFLHREFGIDDPEILYPIFFHSCPIMDVYHGLSKKIQMMVDIVMLADKLSSNYLRINMTRTPVRVDLDRIVFGDSGNELNFSMGLFIARLISQGGHPDEQSLITTSYYHDRLANPFVSKKYSVKTLGGTKLWEPRESQLWKTQQKSSSL